MQVIHMIESTVFSTNPRDESGRISITIPQRIVADMILSDKDRVQITLTKRMHSEHISYIGCE